MSGDPAAGDDLLWSDVSALLARGEALRAVAFGLWSSLPSGAAKAWMLTGDGTAVVRVFLTDRSLMIARLTPWGRPDQRPRMRPYVNAIDAIESIDADASGQVYHLRIRGAADARPASEIQVRLQRSERSRLRFAAGDRDGARLAELLSAAIRTRDVAERTGLWRAKGWITEGETAAWSTMECTSDGRGIPISFASGNSWICTDKALKILSPYSKQNDRTTLLTLWFTDPEWQFEYSFFGQIRNVMIGRSGNRLYEGSTHTTDKQVLAGLEQLHAARSPMGRPPRNLLRERRSSDR